MIKSFPLPVGQQLECKSKVFRFAIGVGLLLVVTLLKFLSGPQVVFSAIYLIPISFMTWFGSRAAGMATAAVAAVSLLLINLSYGHTYIHAAIPYWNASMDLAVFLFVVSALSQAKRVYRVEQELSREDFVTGLQNRRAFSEVLTSEIVRMRRYQHPLTIAYLDFDNFKQVNDKYGHHQGDLLLSIAGKAMRSSVREVDRVARLGGDEFALLFPETDDRAARAILEMLQRNVQEAMLIHQWPVTLSIGTVTFHAPLDSAEPMIDLADHVMYLAKQSGKNGIAQHVVGNGSSTK